MSITATIDLLQAINATVTGVDSAPTFDNYPIGELEESGLTLPIILTFPGSGQWQPRGDNEYKVTRRFEMTCYGRRVYQEDFVTGKQLVIPILDALGQTYLADATYTVGRKFVLQCDPSEVYVSTSEQILDRNESDEWLPIWAGIAYHGFRFSITVVEEDTL